jgi:hypothetical protein
MDSRSGISGLSLDGATGVGGLAGMKNDGTQATVDWQHFVSKKLDCSALLNLNLR